MENSGTMQGNGEKDELTPQPKPNSVAQTTMASALPNAPSLSSNLSPENQQSSAGFNLENLFSHLRNEAQNFRTQPNHQFPFVPRDSLISREPEIHDDQFEQFRARYLNIKKEQTELENQTEQMKKERDQSEKLNDVVHEGMMAAMRAKKKMDDEMDEMKEKNEKEKGEFMKKLEEMNEKIEKDSVERMHLVKELAESRRQAEVKETEMKETIERQAKWLTALIQSKQAQKKKKKRFTAQLENKGNEKKAERAQLGEKK